MSFNTIILVGNLGADPELRYTPQGTPVCQFRMATNDRIKKDGEWVKHTTWYRVTAFGRQGEAAAQYLTKGREVFVQGRHRTEEWEDRDGKLRFTNEVVAEKVQFIGYKDDREDADRFRADQQESAREKARENAPAGSASDLSDDDIPF